MTAKYFKLNDNAKAWYALAKDMRIKDEEIIGLSFVFACFNTTAKIYHEKDSMHWMVDINDYSEKEKTTLSDKYEVTSAIYLNAIYLFNEVIFKLGLEDIFPDDRENANKENDIIFLGKDYKFLPEINKNNYNYSLSIAHNFYACLFYKLSILLKGYSFKDAYELGVLYGYYWHREDPIGFANFFDNLLLNAPPLFKFLCNIDFMDKHAKSLSLKDDMQYLPFQAALQYILDADEIELAKYIWGSQARLFYRNQKLLYPEKQWFEINKFVNEAAIVIEDHYENILAQEGPEYIEILRSKINDKYSYREDMGDIFEFFDKLLFDDYKFRVTDYTANDSYSLQQRACIFRLLSLFKTKNLIMSNQKPDAVH